MFEGLAERARRERDRDVALAWHSAAFERTKKLEKLDRYLSKAPRRSSEPQDWETQFHYAQMFAAAGLGTIQ